MVFAKECPVKPVAESLIGVEQKVASGWQSKRYSELVGNDLAMATKGQI